MRVRVYIGIQVLLPYSVELIRGPAGEPLHQAMGRPPRN